MRLRPVLVCLCFVFFVAGTLSCSEENNQSQNLDSSIPKILNFTSVQVDGAEFDVATLSGEDVLFWFWDPN